MQLNERHASSPKRLLRIVSPSEAVAPSGELSRRAFVWMTIGVVWLGFMVRLGFTLSSDFPLHDGGLFFQMVRDLQASHYALPGTTSYNHASIPFAYPPLALYVAGLLNDATPLSLVNAFRFLPLAASTLTIIAFFLLARSMLKTRALVVAATFAFAMLPRTFLWMIMGGGITRSFGLLFALLMLHSVHQLYHRRDWRFALSATIFASLAVVSHLEMAWFAAFSTALFFVAYGRHRVGLIGSIAVGAGTIVLTAPWWGTVVAQHGLSPFISANSASDAAMSNPIIAFIQYRFTSEPLFPALAALALVGVVACVARREFVLPAWILSALVLDQRAFGTDATVPFAMLIAVGLIDVVLPLAAGLFADSGSVAARRAPAWLTPAFLGVFATYALLSAMLAGPFLLTAMSHDERDSMQWVSANTAPSDRFLIVTADKWFADRTSEWFPTLAHRDSVVTTQGYEWLPGGVFAKRIQQYNDVQTCAEKDGGCLAAWSAASGIEYDYVYIPRLAPRAFLTVADEHECCAALRAALRADAHYRVVFDGPGATIFRRL